jgi:GNAT superfamily N-acetyltransferase
VQIRTASLKESEALEDLQRRASYHWPAYREALAAHPYAIEIPDEQFTARLVSVAEDGEGVAGFHVLLREHGGACELDGIFVEPHRMDAGIGRALIEDAERIVAEQGATRIEVTAGPESSGFYARLGFARTHEVPTRFGPGIRMRLELHTGLGETRHDPRPGHGTWPSRTWPDTTSSSSTRRSPRSRAAGIGNG